MPTKKTKNLLRSAWRNLIVKTWDLIWLERDVSPPAASHRPQAKDLTIRELTKDDLRADSLCAEFAGRAQLFRSMMDNGSRCFGAIRGSDQQVVGLVWAHLGPYHDKDYYRCYFDVPADCFYVFAGEVTPSMQGRTLPFEVLTALLETAREEGIERIRTIVAQNNRASLFFNIRLGYKEVGKISRVRFWLGGLAATHKIIHYQGSRLGHLKRRPKKRAGGVSSNVSTQTEGKPGEEQHYEGQRSSVNE